MKDKDLMEISTLFIVGLFIISCRPEQEAKMFNQVNNKIK